MAKSDDFSVAKSPLSPVRCEMHESEACLRGLRGFSLLSQSIHPGGGGATSHMQEAAMLSVVRQKPASQAAHLQALDTEEIHALY